MLLKFFYSIWDTTLHSILLIIKKFMISVDTKNNNTRSQFMTHDLNIFSNLIIFYFYFLC